MRRAVSALALAFVCLFVFAGEATARGAGVVVEIGVASETESRDESYWNGAIMAAEAFNEAQSDFVFVVEQLCDHNAEIDRNAQIRAGIARLTAPATSAEKIERIRANLEKLTEAGSVSEKIKQIRADIELLASGDSMAAVSGYIASASFPRVYVECMNANIPLCATYDMTEWCNYSIYENPNCILTMPTIYDSLDSLVEYCGAEGLARVAVVCGDRSVDKLITDLFFTAANMADLMIVDCERATKDAYSLGAMRELWMAYDVQAVLVVMSDETNMADTLMLLNSWLPDVTILTISDDAREHVAQYDSTNVVNALKYDLARDSEEMERFKKEYKERFGEEAECDALIGHFNTTVLCEAIVRSGGTSSLPRGLLESAPVKTVLGDIFFSESNNLSDYISGLEFFMGGSK